MEQFNWNAFLYGLGIGLLIASILIAGWLAYRYARRKR